MNERNRERDTEKSGATETCRHIVTADLMDTLSPQWQTEPLLNSHLLWPPSYSVIAWIEDMLERDVNDNRKIGNYGAQHILSGVPRDSVTILTHCNTGSLATAGYGTALGKAGAVGVVKIFMAL